MPLFETPSEVALLLARHMPRNTKRLLDPAVGHAALLLPFTTRLAAGALVVFVDVDEGKLKVSKDILCSNTFKVKCIKGDFLQCVHTSRHLKSSSFDCIVMNPPYAAKKGDWVELEYVIAERRESKYLPKELAFMFRAVELLRNGGRLLAVMPASLVSSSLFSAFRDLLGSIGRFHYVHELPKFTFRGVEGRVYLVVFEKGNPSAKVELRNHDLAKPHPMRIAWNDLGCSRRLDFAYHDSRIWIKKLINGTPELKWVPLKDLFANTART